MKKTLAGIFCLLFACSAAFANGKGYQIKVKINNLKNDTIYLAYYFGDKQYMKDTTLLDEKGMGVFSGKELLPGGFYLIVYPNKSFFDIIVTEAEQNFYIENDTTNYQKNFKSTGSVDNQIFYDDIAFIGKMQQERKRIEDAIKAAGNDEAKKAELKKQLQELDKQVKAQRASISTNYPNSFYAKFLKSLDEVEIPESPKDEKGNEIDSMFQYRYYRSHYFDNIDFTDDRMLRTPTFHQKVMTWMDKVVPQHYDSLGAYCDVIIERSRPNEEMFKYWIITLLNHYAQSKIMCMEAVYVHLAKKYYMTGQAHWTSSEDSLRICDRARKMEPTLCGRVAPNMYLKDTNNVLTPMHAIKAKYMMLYFYDPDCGHCKKETPQMVQAYRKIVDTMGIDFKVYAAPTLHLHKGEYNEDKSYKFSTDPKDRAEWTNFIKDYDLLHWINAADLYLNDNFRALYDINSTPQVFLLDKDKKILAKRFSPEQLSLIIEDLEKRAEQISKSKKNAEEKNALPEKSQVAPDEKR